MNGDDLRVFAHTFQQSAREEERERLALLIESHKLDPSIESLIPHCIEEYNNGLANAVALIRDTHHPDTQKAQVDAEQFKTDQSQRRPTVSLRDEIYDAAMRERERMADAMRRFAKGLEPASSRGKDYARGFTKAMGLVHEEVARLGSLPYVDFDTPQLPRCGAALNIEGAGYVCDLDDGHSLGHQNKEAQALWSDGR